MPEDVGYIRVSSVGQNPERQLDGIKLDEVYEEKASAGTRKRPELEACLKYVRKGDTLHVHSIDRLARNLQDLLKIVEMMRNKAVTVKFHKEGLTFGGGDEPMSKLMLQMMGAFAEFERSLIRERQAEGIARAKKNGKRLGAKPKLNKAQVEEIKQMVADRYKKVDIAQKFKVSLPTIYNVLKR